MELLESYDWETLRTYEDVLDELNGKQAPANGLQALIQQSQKYGG